MAKGKWGKDEGGRMSKTRRGGKDEWGQGKSEFYKL